MRKTNLSSEQSSPIRLTFRLTGLLVESITLLASEKNPTESYEVVIALRHTIFLSSVAPKHLYFRVTRKTSEAFRCLGFSV